MIILIVFIGWIVFSMAWATDYYVYALNGDDSNNGTSIETSWKTIQHAADRMVAGDVCLVLPGVYDERVQITGSGTSEAPILYKAKGSAGRPVITHGFTVRADYIHIKGFEVTDTINKWDNGVGIFVEGSYCKIFDNYVHDVTRPGIALIAGKPNFLSTSHCTVRGNRVERAGLVGIWINGRHHLIEDNDISHTLQYPPKWTVPREEADADGIRFFGSAHVIRRNRIHDILLSDTGNVDPHIDAVQTWGPAYNIVIEQNVFDIPDDRMQGAMISDGQAPVRNLVFRNNIIKAFRGINFWSTNGSIKDVKVINNTFIGDLRHTGESMYAVELNNIVGGRVINNMFYNTGNHEYPYVYEGDSRKIEVGHNAHYMSDQKPPGGTPRPGDVWQMDPRFINAVSGDFSLRPDSPLIDVGANLAMEVPEDFEGASRPQRGSFDIGAFEFTEAK